MTDSNNNILKEIIISKKETELVKKIIIQKNKAFSWVQIIH